MSPALLIALIEFATKFGIDAAIAIADGFKNAKTIDDAIAALKASREKTWEDFKREAQKP
jgi:hypothetical protein